MMRLAAALLMACAAWCTSVHAQTRYSQVAAGGFHACALTIDGAVRCWGSDGAGELGDGQSADRFTSDYVNGLDSGVVAVAAGYAHSCAILAGGSVKCWGWNDYGQSGGTNVYERTPVDVQGLSGVTALALGFSHSCALLQGGGVKCWGANGSGQLGDGTRTDRRAPVDVKGLSSGVTALSASGSNTCAVQGGRGKCWGSNANEQLGIGNAFASSSDVPGDVAGVPVSIVSISPGDTLGCAVTVLGETYCWGHTDFTNSGFIAFTAVKMQGADAAAEVQVQGSHACIRTTGARMRCGGDINVYPEFRDVGLSSVADMGVGLEFACAVPGDGSVQCWGNGSEGQTGRSLGFSSTSTPAPIAEGRTVPAGANFQGLWYRSTQPGWGMNVAHQGDTIFATLFVYDTDGSPMWLVMSRGERTAPGRFVGALYRTTGPPFSAATWNPALVSVAVVGSATLEFWGTTQVKLRYSYGGASAAIMLDIEAFGALPVCGAQVAPGAHANYQALWWASPAGSESGWGVNITHQGDVLFATWFTYDASGRGQWLVMPDLLRSGTETWSGAIYRTRGSPFGAAWNDSARKTVQVGTATFSFSDRGNGRFTYVLDGTPGAKQMTRQLFASAETICAP